MLRTGLVPGLKSVARATAAPASIRRRAGGSWLEPRKKFEPGRRTATTLEPASLRMSAGCEQGRCEVEPGAPPEPADHSEDFQFRPNVQSIATLHLQRRRPVRRKLPKEGLGLRDQLRLARLPR